MFHTKGWKWSVVLLLLAILLAAAQMVAAALLGRWEEKQRESALRQYLFAQPETIDEKGLIFTAITWEDGRTTRAVVRRDPETGEETVISAFTYAAGPAPDSAYYFRTGELVRETFSSDFSRMAATKCFTGTTERHAGWLDTEGNFFDVTEALGPGAAYRYDGPDAYYALGFADCWFGYYQHIPDSTDYMDFFVPVDMMEPGAVQEATYRVVAYAGEDGNPVPRERDDVYDPRWVTDWLERTRARYSERAKRGGSPA